MIILKCAAGVLPSDGMESLFNVQRSCFFVFPLDKYGVPLSPLFFLKKTYWCKSKSRFNGDAPTNELRHGNIFSDNTEALPPEFDGKEAIR